MNRFLNEKWRYRLAKVREAGSRKPCFSDDSLFHVFHYQKGSFYQSSLICFDIETGLEKWRFEETHLLNSPHVDANGNVYVSSFAGSVVCLGTNGTLKWRTDLRDSNMGDLLLLDNGTLVVAEVAGGSRYLYCLDRVTGEPLWKFDGGGHGYQLAQSGSLIIYPCAQNGPDFGRNYGVRLYAIDAATGVETWHVHSTDWMFSVLNHNDILWVGARGSVRALVPKTGQQLDQYNITAEEAVYLLVKTASGIAFCSRESGSICHLTISNKRKFLKKTSKIIELWSSVTDRGLISDFTYIDSQILAATDTGHLLNIDSMNGAIGGSVKIFNSGIQQLTLMHRRIAVVSEREIAVYEL